MKKRAPSVLLSAVVAAALGLALGSVSARAENQKLRFGLVLINLQAKFFNDIAAGATEEAKTTGADLQIIDGNNDPTAQVNAVETLVQQKVDGIIMVAIDVNGVVPALRDAANSGVNVVAVDAKVQDSSVKSFIGVDNAKAGSDFGDFVGKYIQNQMGGKATLGIVGALNSFIQNQRKDSFVTSIKKLPDVTVANTVDGQNVQEHALSAAENLVTSAPNLNVIYATGEPALIGAIAALESQGATSRVKLFGWDLSKQALKALDDGFLVGVVQQNPHEEGVKAVDALTQLAHKESVPAFIDVPVEFVTKDNVAKYRAEFQ